MHEAVTVRVEPGRSSVTLEWPAGPVNDMIADAAAATLLQLQARHARGTLLASPLQDAAEGDAGAADAPVKREGAAAGEADAPSSVPPHPALRAALHAALSDSFGSVTVHEGEAARWELTACGAAVVLHGAEPPFERIECAEEEARERVAKVLERAQRAVLPLR